MNCWVMCLRPWSRRGGCCDPLGRQSAGGGKNNTLNLKCLFSAINKFQIIEPNKVNLINDCASLIHNFC
jgi:hypothetical protein